MTNRVQELRLVITTDDFERAVAFWRDSIGLKEQISVGDDDGHVVILGAGIATLEISDRKHAEFIDNIEVGRPVGGQFRVALRFDDVPAATDMLEAAGARGARIAPADAVPLDQLAARGAGWGAADAV